LWARCADTPDDVGAWAGMGLASGRYQVLTDSGKTEMTEAKTNGSGAGSNAGASIFVVDDEAMLLELAYVILHPAGFDIKTFRDPESALAAYAAANPRPALVITDYAMHTMNGMDLTAECRKLNPAQKVLMLSGTVGPEVFDGARYQPDRFLGKPYHARQLVDIVKSMLQG
jgi:DNA-binding NtrC family response regulator